jgi:hypothetical protein
MPDYTLEITLLSDTAFSMGAGIAGLVDSEIQHDEYGLPTLSGRAIKGLLTNACSEILYALGQATEEDRWVRAAQSLFGVHGEMIEAAGELCIGDATLAPDLRASLAHTQSHPNPSVSCLEIIESLTDLRRQTAMNECGAPDDETLRAIRVLISGLTLYAPVHFAEDPEDDEKALFAACIKGVKRAGLGRNRGKGKLKFELTGRSLDPKTFSETDSRPPDLIGEWFLLFQKAISQEAAA